MQVDEQQHLCPKTQSSLFIGSASYCVVRLFLQAHMLTSAVFLCHFVSPDRQHKSNCVYSKETQKQQETSHALHYLPAAGAGAQVSPEAVPLHRRESRVLQLAQPDGDPGEDLVPKQEGQSQETAGGRAGKVQTGLQARAARLRAAVPYRGAHGLSNVGPVKRLPEAQSAGPGTVQWTRHLWDVLFVIVFLCACACVFLRERKMMPSICNYAHDDGASLISWKSRFILFILEFKDTVFLTSRSEEPLHPDTRLCVIEPSAFTRPPHFFL